MNNPFERFQSLSSSTLEQLCQLLSIDSSALPATHTVQQITGYEIGADVTNQLRTLMASGWSKSQIAVVLKTILRERKLEGSSLFDLVLSGPDISGIPTRSTHAVMHSLIAEAEKEVLLVGYVIYNATALLEPLAKRMQINPSLDVWCCLDIKRKKDDTSSQQALLQKFRREFDEYLWPWLPRPSVHYDPRSLSPWGARSSLHAKCLVVDRKASLITSANFTDAAQHRNIEAGVLSRDPNFSARLYGYFDGMRNQKELVMLPD